MCRENRWAFGVLSPMLCFKKTPKPQENYQTWCLTRKVSLVGTALPNILALVAISASNNMVKHGRLLCSAEIQVPFFLLAATAAHRDLETGFGMLGCSESSALNGCLTWRPAWPWMCTSRKNMYYWGTHSFKTNFEVNVKNRISKVKSPSSIYIYI